jgi:tetratricopeptide (TPR) repeat protein
VEEIHREGPQPGPIGGNQAQVFNPWLVVDVVGSPGLTGLIGALTLDLCEEISDFDLSAPYSDDLEGEFELRNAELDSGTIVSEEGDNLQNSPPSVPVDITDLLRSFSRRSRYRIPTPFDELYPFPQVAPKSVVLLGPRTDHLMSSYALTEQEIKCRRKFKALKNMAPQEIMDLVEDMRSIACRHYLLDNYRCQEVWLRRIITSSLKIPWHQPLEILRVCLWIIDALRFQCKYTSARSLHQDLHPKILKLVRSDHGLAICSRQTLAKLTIGGYSQATAWREVLQICLLNFGPRHWETIGCLSGLGTALLNNRQLQEAETINYIYLQLPHIHANPLYGRFFHMGAIAKSLSIQQKFEDCASVLSAAESLFGAWIRFDDCVCWGYYNEKAKVLRYLGRFLESEDILRGILRHAPGHPGIEVWNAMRQLVNLLMETDRSAEALIWQEKLFLMTAEMYGFGHSFSQASCKDLGFGYADLGRYEDAIVYFQQTAGKVALGQTEDAESRDDFIKKIRGWISEVEKMKEEQAKTVELQPIVESMPPDSSGMCHLMISMSDQYCHS